MIDRLFAKVEGAGEFVVTALVVIVAASCAWRIVLGS
jgi:hypothetical protein